MTKFKKKTKQNKYNLKIIKQKKQNYKNKKNVKVAKQLLHKFFVEKFVVCRTSFLST